MDIKLRDDAIAKNRLLLRVLLIWSVLSSVSLIIISMLCFTTFNNKEIHWLPVCTANELSIGGNSYSASYMKEMVNKVIGLRFTYNPKTVDDNYQTLINLAPVSKKEALKSILTKEKITIKNKNISSVFYIDSIKMDVKHHIAKVEGMLQRTLHDLTVKPKYKKYMVQFSFNKGLLSPVLIKEISND